MDYNLLIGGAAGQGIDTLGFLLEKTIQRNGYFLFSNKDYMSRIRGGHNFTQIRFGTDCIESHRDKLDFIFAFNDTTVNEHKDRLSDNGYIVLDEKLREKFSDITENMIFLPMSEKAEEIGNSKVLNTLFFGAGLKALKLDYEIGENLLESAFDKKILDINKKALKEGYSLNIKEFEIDSPKDREKRILINSNQGIALGAMAAGLSFYTAYPMTPSTSIMNFIAANQKKAGIIVEQAEDEIAAINMAIGASFAGARSMTATSGGGFSLMTESLGLAGMTETPLVLVNVQRPGPATGLPTRTEQSDLSFILTASHGEIPRLVTVVRNAEEAFYKTAQAFNIAEKYQVLVIILNDQFLADVTQTITPYDFDKVRIERHIEDGSNLKEDTYNRYEFTKEGISPRIIPGFIKGKTVLADSDEHDEHGNITESAEMRVKMMEKRMSKLKKLEEIVEEPWEMGEKNPEVLLLCWGSTYGTVKEALKELSSTSETTIGALCFGDLWPLPTNKLMEKAKTAKKIINIEQNYTGQLAKLIRQETGIKCTDSILKFDGRQISLEEVVSRVKEVL